jgi:hypothetical protein
VGRKFTGQQFRVGAGDIDVAVKFHPKGIDAPFPALHFLNLIEEKISLAVDARYAPCHLVVQDLRRAEPDVAHILKIEYDAPGSRNALFDQFLPDQFHHDGLSAAPHAGQDLDRFLADEGTNAAHVRFAFDHEQNPPSPSVQAISAYHRYNLKSTGERGLFQL